MLHLDCYQIAFAATIPNVPEEENMSLPLMSVQQWNRSHRSLGAHVAAETTQLFIGLCV